MTKSAQVSYKQESKYFILSGVGSGYIYYFFTYDLITNF